MLYENVNDRMEEALRKLRNNVNSLKSELSAVKVLKNSLSKCEIFFIEYKEYKEMEACIDELIERKTNELDTLINEINRIGVF